MLRGWVTPAREAVVPLVVQAPSGRRLEAEAAIDTGFTGALTLPPSLVSDLELPLAGSTVATLADGRSTSLELYLATVEWHDDAREVLVIQADGGVLVGMALLEGSRLVLDVIDGGPVTVREISTAEATQS